MSNDSAVYSVNKLKTRERFKYLLCTRTYKIDYKADFITLL